MKGRRPRTATGTFALQRSFTCRVRVFGNVIGCPMKIAQIAPLMESVPPRYYGGTERVVSYLTEELVAQGHEVTLFASGDSITAADLVPCSTQALRLDAAVKDVVPYYMLMLDKVRSRFAEFDVLHFHIDHFHFPVFRHLAVPSLTTLHGRQDLRDCLPFFAGFSDMPLVSISDAQRTPVPHANFAATIHHGLPPDLHEANYRPNGGYLAFIGRVSSEKGPVDAIRIAQSLGISIKIAAKVDKQDEPYFREVVQPMLSAPGVDFIGEISEREKGPFLRNATALLFPICWPEPFGLVMIEAMACGTPVLAYRAGAVPEVIDEGVSGMIVDNIDQARVALLQVGGMDRRKVRARFEERFTARRMASDYVRLYRSLVRRAPRGPRDTLHQVTRFSSDELADDDARD
jgi:glycosyltransferase involved in cell wall biosynthesis